jgi:hypothetical protein
MTAIIVVGSIFIYFALGCAVGISVYHRPATQEWHVGSCSSWRYARGREPECDCGGRGSISGVLGAVWPFTLVFLCVYALMKGRAPKGTRLGRAQRKAQRLVKRIEQMEKDMGL